MTDRATPIWPFPGQSSDRWWEAYPPHNLPPPRFAVGDRVTTRWGSATVLRIHDWEHFGSRGYHLRFAGSDAPAGFGNTWGEADMQPLVERQAAPEPEEVFQPVAVPGRAVEQMALF